MISVVLLNIPSLVFGQEPLDTVYVKVKKAFSWTTPALRKFSGMNTIDGLMSFGRDDIVKVTIPAIEKYLLGKETVFDKVVVDPLSYEGRLRNFTQPVGVPPFQ